MDADDMEGMADEVLPGGKDTVSICLITGFESFNVSLYNQVRLACDCYVTGVFGKLSPT